MINQWKALVLAGFISLGFTACFAQGKGDADKIEAVKPGPFGIVPIFKLKIPGLRKTYSELAETNQDVSSSISTLSDAVGNLSNPWGSQVTAGGSGCGKLYSTVQQGPVNTAIALAPCSDKDRVAGYCSRSPLLEAITSFKNLACPDG